MCSDVEVSEPRFRWMMAVATFIPSMVLLIAAIIAWKGVLGQVEKSKTYQGV
jgi:hypothetical protein